MGGSARRVAVAVLVLLLATAAPARPAPVSLVAWANIGYLDDDGSVVSQYTELRAPLEGGSATLTVKLSTGQTVVDQIPDGSFAFAGQPPTWAYVDHEIPGWGRTTASWLSRGGLVLGACNRCVVTRAVAVVGAAYDGAARIGYLLT